MGFYIGYIWIIFREVINRGGVDLCWLFMVLFIDVFFDLKVIFMDFLFFC